MATDPQTLLAQAKCFECFGSNLYTLDLMKLSLTANWLTGLTPTPPVTAPPTNPDIASNSSDGNLIVTWSQASAPTTNEVWKSTNGGAYVLFASVAGGLTQKVDNTVMAVGDLFEYKIRAVTGGVASAFTSIVGSKKANLFAGAAVSISFPTVVFGVGDLRANVMANLTTYSFPAMHDCTDSAGTINCTLCATYNLSKLKTSGGFVQCTVAPIVGALNYSALVSTNLGIDVSSGTTMSSITANSLTSVGDYIAWDSDPNLASISLPSLGSVTGNFRSQSCASLTSVSCPTLGTVGGDFMLWGCPLLATINFAALNNVQGSVDFSGTNLTTVSFPTPLNVCQINNYFGAGALGQAGAAAVNLGSFSAPGLFINDNAVVIDFSGCDLDVASINQILRRGVVSGVTTCDFELAGGTNAAPAGQGIIDKATLIGAGNTVNTN